MATLLETWRNLAYGDGLDDKKKEELWTNYFTIEKGIYEKILSNPTEVVEGTVKELAENTLKVVLGDTTYVNVNRGQDDKALSITKVEGNTISASGDITGITDLAPGAEVNISKITFTAETSSGVSYDYTVSVGRTVTNK